MACGSLTQLHMGFMMPYQAIYYLYVADHKMHTHGQFFSHFASLDLQLRVMSQFYTEPVQWPNGMDRVQQVLKFSDVYY